MKKALSVILSLIMLFGITSGIDLSAAAYTGYSDTPIQTGSYGEGVYFAFNSDTGLLNISGNGEIYKKIVLGFEQARQPFSNNKSVKTVIIEKGITGIGDAWAYVPGAFQGCSNLTGVIIHDGFVSIGEAAFDGCTNLKFIMLPDSVTNISYYAFKDCDDLTICCSADSYAARYAKNHNIKIDVHDNSHDMVIAYDKAVKATCRDDGRTEGCHCEVCEKVLVPQELVPKTEKHTPIIDYAVEPTCRDYGRTEGSRCGVCGKVLVPQRLIPKTEEHTPIVDCAVEPTCVKTGLTVGSHCKVCGKVIIPQEVVPKNEHTPVTMCGVEPTCTNSGLTEGSRCDVCDIIIKPQHYISPTGHSYMSVVTPATITTDEITTYTCAKCGYTYSKTVSLDLANLKAKAISLSLESDLTMNFKVPKKYFEGRFDNLYVEFTQNGKKIMVTTAFYYDENYYTFPYSDISPQSMNDTVTATVYGIRNGILYHGETVDFSVARYAYGMLERESENIKLRTLLVDLLNYGASAQIYQNYKTDDLVNAGLTDEQKRWASSEKLNLVNVADKNYSTVENSDVIWKSVGINLSNGIALRYTFNTNSIDGIQFKLICQGSEDLVSFADCAPVDNGDGTYIYKNGFAVLTDNGNGTYTIVLEGIYADMMQEEVYITAMRGDTAVSNTIRYSVESYAKQVQDKMPDSKLRKLTDSMMRYGISAANYGR